MKNESVWVEKVKRVLRIDGILFSDKDRAIKSLSECVASKRLINTYLRVVIYE
jgi:hypothetical protein